MTVKIGERFKPDLSFKTLQYIYLLIGVLVLLLCGVTIITLISSFNLRIAMTVAFIFLIICLLILVPSIIWINLYYLSLFYTFTESEIIIERGPVEA